ncbi:MAG: protein translocase subunit SecF [bacterium]|nr:protein translocase subunit SecF [bacterium]
MENKKGILDIVKYRWIWICFSAVLLLPGIVAMGYSTVVNKTPLLLGIDFTGGTMLQYGFDREITKEDEGKIRTIVTNLGIDNPVIQTSAPVVTKAKEEVKEDADEVSENETGNVETKITETAKEEVEQETTQYVVSIKTRYLETTEDKSEAGDIYEGLKKEFGDVQILQVNAIGPTLGAELFKNAIITLLLAFAGIIIYLTFRFQFDYSLFAFLALLHDAIFILGTFSIFGLLYHTQVDALFITAILTVIGFSVHDTIVVYDRIRENNRFLAKKMTFGEIANISVNQTLMRSIATSVTTLLTLLALYFLGGETTKDFVLVMILGIIIGTYSSIFFASTLLVMYREHVAKQKALARQRY